MSAGPRCHDGVPERPSCKYPSILQVRKEGLQWEGFAEKGGFKPGKKE